MIRDALTALLFISMVLAPCFAAMGRKDLQDDDEGEPLTGASLTGAGLTGANKVH